MDQPPLIVSLASNVLFLVIFTFVFVVIFHLIFVWLYPLGKVGWKVVDYVWLLIAAIGLVSTSSDARRIYATNILEKNHEIRTKTSYSSFRRRVEASTAPFICMQFQRTEYSPPNLDEIQKEYDSACEYYKKLLNELPPNITDEMVIVKMPSKPLRPSVTDKFLQQYFGEVDQDYESYAQNHEELINTKKSQDRLSYELTAAFFGPFFFALALALRITKVTGEILIEIRSKKESE